jgi:hypothetical protein
MGFVGTAEHGADALGQFARRQQAIGLDHLALAMHPLGFMVPNLLHGLSVDRHKWSRCRVAGHGTMPPPAGGVASARRLRWAAVGRAHLLSATRRVSGRRSATATGSSQWGQGPPGPTRRQNTLQSAQRCSPSALAPQVGHSYTVAGRGVWPGSDGPGGRARAAPSRRGARAVRGARYPAAAHGADRPPPPARGRPRPAG